MFNSFLSDLILFQYLSLVCNKVLAIFLFLTKLTFLFNFISPSLKIQLKTWSLVLLKTKT